MRREIMYVQTWGHVSWQNMPKPKWNYHVDYSWFSITLLGLFVSFSYLFLAFGCVSLGSRLACDIILLQRQGVNDNFLILIYSLYRKKNYTLKACVESQANLDNVLIGVMSDDDIGLSSTLKNVRFHSFQMFRMIYMTCPQGLHFDYYPNGMSPRLTEHK
jgi:hypothetical protein